MSYKLSQEEFESEIFKMYNNEYIVKSEYKGGKYPIDILHTKCNNIFTYNNANNFKLGRSKCPYCHIGSKVIDDDIFNYRVKKLVGDDYTILSKYQKSNIPIKMRHNKCKCKDGFYDFEITPHLFFSGHRCPYDSNQQGYNIENFKDRLKQYHPNYICLGSKYINSRTPIDVKCDKGHIYSVSLDNIKKGCPFCSNKKVFKGFNDLWTTHPYIAELLVNPEDGYTNMYGTNKELEFKCPDCNKIISKKPYLVLNKQNKFICVCNDNFSYPEKFVYNFLEQLNVDFIYQLSNANFNWCGKYRYDFYIPNENLIIEVHGRQHYGQVMFQDPNNIKENDMDKYKLAVENGCNYCVINASFSQKNYIMESISKSILSKIFNIENINWDNCETFASKSILYSIVDLWNNESKNVQYISKKLKISDKTTYCYLEKGNDLNLCIFNRDEYAKNAKLNAHKDKLPVNAIAVKSVETGIIYHSMAQARLLCNAHLTSDILNNDKKTSAKQHWVYA